MTEDQQLIPTDLDAIEAAVMDGDFSGLTQVQRLHHMRCLCKDLGLDIRRAPFQWIVLNNKLVPYAKKACTDQLRDIHDVSIQITDQQIVQGVYTVQVRATTPDGRSDEDIGASPADGMVGDALANSMKRAVTQAKRRVTLSICGLGMLDETEVAQIPSARAPKEEGVKRIKPPPIKATLPRPPRVVEVDSAAAEAPVIAAAVGQGEKDEAAYDALKAVASVDMDSRGILVTPPQTTQPQQVEPIAGAIPMGTVKPAKLPPAAAPIKVRSGLPKAKE